MFSFEWERTYRCWRMNTTVPFPPFSSVIHRNLTTTRSFILLIWFAISTTQTYPISFSPVWPTKQGRRFIHRFRSNMISMSVTHHENTRITPFNVFFSTLKWSTFIKEQYNFVHQLEYIFTFTFITIYLYLLKRTANQTVDCASKQTHVELTNKNKHVNQHRTV